MEGEGGEEARDQAYQAEDREDWDQAYQADREDAPDCAYCTVGGVMHAYQAYRADGKFEAVMDSGANINIFTDELENGLTNARQSRISVGGFTGASVRASKDGTAHMYVFDPSDPSTGKHISVPATTMKGGANSNLISAWHLVSSGVSPARFHQPASKASDERNRTGVLLGCHRWLINGNDFGSCISRLVQMQLTPSVRQSSGMRR